MAEIGNIKTVKREGDYIVATVATGSGVEITGIIMSPLGAEFFPIVDDTVIFQRTGNEIVIMAGLSVSADGVSGDVGLFSRDADGVKKATLWLRANGLAEITNESGFFKLAANGQFNANDNFTVDP